MDTRSIVQTLWNMANILKDDGVSYQNYITELTFILFLKMMKEQGTEEVIPAAYRWDELVSKEGLSLKQYYKQLLLDLGNPEIVDDKRINTIYKDATTSIEEPKNLEKLIKSINELDWYSAKHEGLGDLYEGLMEKNGNETKSGAGQYFTPRPLIDVMVELMKPQVGERLNDPAAGTFGFMIAADHYMKKNNNGYFDLDSEQYEFQTKQALSGMELVASTHRLALMNALLHDIDCDLRQGDSLSANGKWMKDFDLVLTNPPFGTKKGGERATRDDLTFETSNKQFNFLQVIYNSLKPGGRAAVVLPDNILFATDVSAVAIRKDLLEKCNLHTILRLPAGIFYAQGVQTNVLFLERGKSDKGHTKEIWYYDMRTEMKRFGKTNPLTRSDFKEFIELYTAEKREETFNAENTKGRWKRYTIEEIQGNPDCTLDFSWIVSDELENLTIEGLMADIESSVQAINEAFASIQEILGEDVEA